jgi:hypothetical protein
MLQGNMGDIDCKHDLQIGVYKGYIYNNKG